jgi:hypothetical protein
MADSPKIRSAIPGGDRTVNTPAATERGVADGASPAGTHPTSGKAAAHPGGKADAHPGEKPIAKPVGSPPSGTGPAGTTPAAGSVPGDAETTGTSSTAPPPSTTAGGGASDVTGKTESSSTTDAAGAPTPAAGAAPAAPTSDITPGPGGVMTDEVGVVTGDLTLRTDYTDGHAVVHVQYKDADEWYAVTGGRTPIHDPADIAAVHAVAVGILHRPEG